MTTNDKVQLLACAALEDSDPQKADMCSKISTQTLIEASNDTDDDVRIAALECMQNREEKDVEEILIKSLKDKREIVRTTACKSLTHIKSPAVDDALINILKRDNDIDVRCAAAKALGNRDSEEVLSTLKEAFNYYHKTAVAAVLSIASLDDKKRRIEMLTELAIKKAEFDTFYLFDYDSPHVTAVACLSKERDPLVTDTLLKIYNNKKSTFRVKYTAIEALSKIRSNNITNFVIDVLNNPKDSDYHRAIITGISKDMSHKVTETLIKLLEKCTGESNCDCLLIIHALANRPGNDVTSALIKSSRESDLCRGHGNDFYVNQYASLVTEEILQGRLLNKLTPTLIETLDNADTKLRKAAITLLMKRGYPSESKMVTNALIKICKDKELSVAIHAVESLGLRGEKVTFQALEELAFSSVKDARLAAIRALSIRPIYDNWKGKWLNNNSKVYYGFPRTKEEAQHRNQEPQLIIDLLVKLAKDGDTDVMKKAIEILKEKPNGLAALSK